MKVDAVWFMGVWERSPAGIAVANRNKGLLEDFQRALPDFRPEDNVGSPYCVRRYAVDEHLGGREGLAIARRELANRGLRLILDFVPNHVAPDHPWVIQHPEYLVQGNAEEARNDPASFCEAGGKVFACGRDPYFPAWPDVLQLNAFQPGLRRAVIETLLDMAGQCDGIRCDMAMLMLNDIFGRTWGSRAGEKPEGDYWTTVISAIKAKHPEFKFMAEAYWDLEWTLQQQGFDFCYDKKLYDRLEHDPAEKRPASSLRGPRLSGPAGPVHRESRRAPRRGGLPARQAKGGGRDRRYPSGGKASARRTVRGAEGPAPCFSGPPPR